MKKILATVVLSVIAGLSFAAPAAADTLTPAPSTTRTVAHASVVGGGFLVPTSQIEVTLDNGRSKVLSSCEASSDRRCWMFIANVPYVNVHFGRVVGWVRVPVTYDGGVGVQ